MSSLCVHVKKRTFFFCDNSDCFYGNDIIICNTLPLSSQIHNECKSLCTAQGLGSKGNGIQQIFFAIFYANKDVCFYSKSKKNIYK